MVKASLAIPALLFVLGIAVACGTDAKGVDACRTLESTRCERAVECGISLDTPPHEGAPGTDVESCKRFYAQACLHGLVSNQDPGGVEVTACRDAIRSGSCDVVRAPETAPACAFLIPADEPADAGTPDSTVVTDAAPSDGSVDASTPSLDGASPF